MKLGIRALVVASISWVFLRLYRVPSVTQAEPYVRAGYIHQIASADSLFQDYGGIKSMLDRAIFCISNSEVKCAFISMK